MSSKVEFQILYGATQHEPLSYMLSLDGFNILLDCGWTDAMDVSVLEPLKRIAPTVNVVLVSHPDVAHLGALPYAFKHFGLRAAVYATMPVFNMGEMFMYDLVLSKMHTEGYDTITLDDVDAAFEYFHALKYSQRSVLAEVGIDVTPYSAGRMVGGTVWKITKDLDDIVYAVGYNHKRERHLNPSVLETLTRPSLLITDAFNALTVQESRKKRDKELLSTVGSVMKKGGNVLLCSDAAGRVLELLLLLDSHWAFKKFSHPLAFLSPVSYPSIEFAKSQLEWMSDTVMKSFDQRRENPFLLKHVHICHTLEEVNALPEPKMVLATTETMNTGYSRVLFARWAAESKNCVILTSRQPQDCFASEIYDRAANGRTEPVNFEIHYKVPLEGEELEHYLEQKQRMEEEERERRESEKLLYGEEAPGTENGSMDVAEDEEKEETESMDVLQTLSSLVDSSAGIGGADGMEVEETGEQLFIDAKGELSSYDFYVGSLPSAFPPVQGGAKKGQAKYVPLPMFPTTNPVEEDTWDSYGVDLRAEDLNVRSDAATEEEPKTAMDTEEVVEEVQKVEEVPCKYIVEEINMVVKAKVVRIDFEGRSDGRSVRNIINHVAPRRLIIVHGSDEARKQLAEYCSQNISNCNAVVVPTDEPVDVSSDTVMFSLKISETLMKRLAWQEVGEYDVAYIDGVVRGSMLHVQSPSPDVGGGGKEDAMETESNEIEQSQSARSAQNLPIIEEVNEKERMVHNVVFVGDLLLTEMKRKLIAAGFDAELSSGVLVINSGVASVRKEHDAEAGKSRFTLDGIVCADYYRIRSMLYSQFNVF